MSETGLKNHRNIHVLLIEDEELDCELVRYRLSEDPDHEYHIEIANTLIQASERIPAGNIDVIIADLGLPDSPNHETTVETLTRLSNGIPLVVLTGHDDNEFAIELVRRGIQDYVVKYQVTRHILTRAILEAIERQRQIREQENLRKKLEQLALQDTLTDLLNRRGLEQILKREISWSKREKTPLSALLFDLDNFKTINEQYGYVTGDEAIKLTAQIFKTSLRSTDYISRIGGDEFLVLLPGIKLNEALLVAAKIHSELASVPIPVKDGSLFIQISSGAIEVTHQTETLQDLIAEANLALRNSKQSGKGGTSVASTELKSELEHEEKLIHLKMMRDSEIFKTSIQGIVDIQTGSLVAYELLSHADFDPYRSPNDFFQFGIKHNILTLIDQKCLEQSLKQSRKLPEQLARQINLFSATLAKIEPEELNRIFGSVDLKNNFTIEVDQQYAAADPTSLTAAIEILRKLGIKVGLQGVGPGRTRLDDLIILSPHYIKLHPQLSDAVAEKNPLCINFIRSLRKMTAALDVRIVASHVESKECAEAMRSFGIDWAQGFFFHRPEPIENKF